MKLKFTTMMPSVNLKRNPHLIHLDSEDDDDLDDEVFIQTTTSPIQHPSPKPRKTTSTTSKIQQVEFRNWRLGIGPSARKTSPKKFNKLSQRQLCLALFMILILDCLTIFGLVNGKYPWIFITSMTVFTLMALFISLDLIRDHLKKNGCCSNEIKVSRVFNAHNNDEYIDIDY